MKSRKVLWEEIFPWEIEQIKWKDLNAQENTPLPAYKHMQTNKPNIKKANKNRESYRFVSVMSLWSPSKLWKFFKYF